MKRRPRRTLPATLTALALLAAGAVVAVVAIQLIINERPWIDYGAVATALHDTRWRDTVVLYTGIGAAVVGLILIAAAVLPGRPTVLPLSGDRENMDSGASRRSLRSTLRAAASGVDGVASAKLALGSRRARTAVRTNRTVTEGLDESVRTAVDHRLDQITPQRRPALAVRVHAPRNPS